MKCHGFSRTIVNIGTAQNVQEHAGTLDFNNFIQSHTISYNNESHTIEEMMIT